MAYCPPGSRFQEDNYHVVSINEDQLVLEGGGDFYYDDKGTPDGNTRDEAERLAKKYNMVITGSRGEWWSYSEYTPDPGNVSIFDWRKA
jgi:hypothetical protein